MLFTHSIEQTLVAWHKNVPHLRGKHRDWLANNAWRLVIIGAGLAIYSLFALIPWIITALALSPSINVIGPSIPYETTIPGLGWLALSLTGIVFFISGVILACAVYPIMEMRKLGWDLTFTAYALNVLMGIITTIMAPTLFELIALLSIAFGAGYLLLEIRSSFVAEKSKSRVKS